MLYVFGLGNYPAQYTNTRHNVGVDTLIEIAAFYQVKLRKRCFRLYKEAKINTAVGKVSLIFPLTFMNESGKIIPSLVKEDDEVLVLCDQMDLPPGRLKLKKGGSDAGHNGLKSMLKYLPNKFMRLYIGIGHPSGDASVVEHVLSRPSSSESELISRAKAEAVAAIIEYFRGEKFEIVQQRINSFKA